DGATGVTDTAFYQCQFTGMVAASGDGIHFVGVAGNLISQLRIDDCNFDGCSQASVGGEQGFEYLWITQSYMANCETEIMLVSTADLTSNSIEIVGNQINHSGA